MADPGVIGTHTMHEQENQLVEAETDQKGYPRRDACVPDVQPIAPAPPLDHHAQDKEWNAEPTERYRGCVKDRTASRGGVDPVRDGFIHAIFGSLWFELVRKAYMNERRIHQVFEVSILLKGAHALIECLGGLALAFVSTSTISAVVNMFTQEELIEDPHDLIATHLLAFSQNFSVSSKHFYAFYLLSHGAIKVLLVIGLLKGKLWSYPASIVVLGIFILYQIYRYIYTKSPGLVVLTVFDLFVLGLIWHEYRLVRRHFSGESA